MNPYEQISEAVTKLMAAKTEQYQREIELRAEAVLLETDIVLHRILTRLVEQGNKRTRTI